MDAEERKSLSTSQSNEIYRAIGEYIVTYEQLMHEVNTGILGLLRLKGLTQQEFSQILTSNTRHSDIVEKYRAMCESSFQLEDIAKEIFERILKEVRVVIDQRNGVIHKVWYVGYGNEETQDFSEATGGKHRIHKGKLRYQSGSITATKLDEFTKHLREVKKTFGRLSTCLSSGYSITNNLTLNADGSVSDPTDSGN